MVKLLLLLADFFPTSLRVATPYLFGALAGLWSERAGVVHIGLEGMLLIAAFAATIGTATGGTLAGIAIAMTTALIVSAIFGVLVVYRRADPIVVGVALNLFADGATRFLLHAIYASSSNSPRIDRWAELPGLAYLHPLFVVGLLLVGATHWLLKRSAFGLRVRAAGEAPAALTAAAISVPRTQFLALCVSGPIVALGGVYLAWDSHQFGSGMAGGRGFLALAALVIGRRRPVGVLLAAIGLGAAEASEVTLFSGSGAPRWLVQALPHILTLLVLALRRPQQRNSA